MTPNRCARCNWRPEDGETLAEHAEAAGHPLCTACSTSLPGDRPRVCRDCQDANSQRLAEVLEMWRELPAHLARHAAARIPGGDVLVLAGPGARGVQGADDPEVHQLIDDNVNADTPSVAWTLVSWADDWRRIRDEEDRDRESVDGHCRLVEDAHVYLTEQAAWAAAEHWAWAEYAADIRHLHGALLRATGRHRAPTKLGLLCFACHGQLVYQVIRDADADPPRRRARWWVDTGVAGPVDEVTWRNRHLGTAGLEEDVATCRDCGVKYDAAALMSAQRVAVDDAQWFTDEDGERWGTVRALAEYVHRSHWSLRSWRRQGLVRSCTQGGEVYLHLADVEAHSEVAPRRKPRSTEQAEVATRLSS
jgi:hypothetical protein